MDFELWLIFVTSSVAILIVPGPTTLLVISYAMDQGRRMVIAAVLGVVVADVTLLTISVAGIGAAAAASPFWFEVVQWVGVAFLIYLGGHKLWNGSNVANASPTLAIPKLRSHHLIFFHTSATTLLNPKSLGFFFAFVPQFIKAGSPIGPQYLVLLTTFAVLSATNILVYALTAGTLRETLVNQRVAALFPKITGSIFLVMGIVLGSNIIWG